MSLTKVIIIATSHATTGSSIEPTGVWFEELATPYYQFVDAGFEVDIASIRGGTIPVDPRSQKDIGNNEDSVDRFLRDKQGMQKLTTSISIEGVEFSKYDVLFFPGGHGTMWDFPNQPVLSSAIANALEDERIVAAVCHGPAVLIGATFSNGKFVVDGKRVAGFTNTEETAAGLDNIVPFLLEDKLVEMGGVYQKAANFESFAVQDGYLITGQNPASSAKVAQLIIDTLFAKDIVEDQSSKVVVGHSKD